MQCLACGEAGNRVATLLFAVMIQAWLSCFPSTPRPWPRLCCPPPIQSHFPSGLWFTLCTPTPTRQSWAIQVLWSQRTEDQFQLA